MHKKYRLRQKQKLIHSFVETNRIKLKILYKDSIETKEFYRKKNLKKDCDFR